MSLKPKIEIRPFEVDDAKQLKGMAIERGANLLDWAEAMAMTKGPAFTGLVDGKVAGCGGVVVLWDGVGEAWSIFPDWAKKYKRYVLLYCRRFMEESAEDLKLWRVQATLEEGLPESWLEHLGFVKKCTMTGYQPDGSDAGMWEKIWPERNPYEKGKA